jgi:tetratricopeptide (TPR) repeat protein
MVRKALGIPGWTALGAILCLLVAAPAGLDAAQKKKKPKPGGQGAGQQQGQQNPPGTPPPPPPPPEPPPAAVATVERKLAEYKTSEARSALDPVAGQADSNGYVAVALGRVLEQEKKYGDAVTRLRKAAELAPSDPAPHVYLGEVYLRLNQRGEADGEFRRAAELAQGASGGEALYYLGVAQQRLRQFDQAVETLERARAARPGDALVPYQIGITRAFQENWGATVEQLDRAVGMDSGLAYAYYYRGLANEKLGRKDRLINDLERFVALAPNAPEADRARAIISAARR